jgi:N-hydroxyarylamine O-acetyltransferase
MIDNTFTADSYLQRIGHDGNVHHSEDGLERLQRAQLLNIPFENFDVLLHGAINLEPRHVFNKLIHRRRGGYCFELNGLFLAALHCFGFAARPLLARVHRHGSPSGRGHQLSLVTLHEKQFICDVGFGIPFLPAPLPLECNRTMLFAGKSFRLTEVRPFGIMLQQARDDEWLNLYSFDLGHVCSGDIAYGNHYTSTHPNSIFTANRIGARLLPDGEISLFNTTFKRRTHSEEEVIELRDDEAYLDVLRHHFGIELDVPIGALPPMTLKETLPPF